MNKTLKRYLPMALCFLVAVIATVLLIVLMSVLQSKKIHKVYTFDEELILNNGVLTGDNYGYLYNEYGGGISESGISSIPLSQYGGPEADFLFYEFDNRYYGVDSLFNGCVTSDRFLTKHNGILYQTDIYLKECSAIKPEINFHSASTQGTYLLAIDGNDFYFYKKANSDYKLEDAVKSLLDADNVEFCFWINDRYVLARTDLIYVIIDAENGEALPCLSLDDDQLIDKEIISKRYFHKVSNDKTIKLFDIYTQDDIVFKYKNSNATVSAVSDDGKYAVVNDGEYIIINNKGKTIPLSEFVDGGAKDVVFLANNILLVTYIKDNAIKSSIYKIML